MSLLLPNQIGLRVEQVEITATELQSIVKTISPSVPCPGCCQISNKEQSRYQRTLSDLMRGRGARYLFESVRKKPYSERRVRRMLERYS